MKRHFISLNVIIIFCALFSSEKIFAQLGFCNGNSGDPIFTETFGTGTTPGPQLPAGTTTYTFTTGDPQDGFYTISNTTAYFDWHATSDHTNDTNGKCLIVNASFTAGEFYIRTVSGLCENTTYEFSSYLLNLLPSGGCGGNGIPVNVKFEIWDNTDTNLLASGDTGNIGETTTPIWLQYGLVFQTLPGQTSVILKMINNGIGGCGNDLAIDDIVFKSCGDNISISDASNNNNINICSNQTPYTTTLMVTPDNSVFSTHFYQWEESTDGTTWIDITGETAQTTIVSGINTSSYFRAKVAESAVNLNNSLCNVVSEVFQVVVNQLPIAPTIECWETAIINNAICSWEITGTQPVQPTIECWETSVFNNTTCVWDVSGTQPIQPTLECWETAIFNNATCSWEVTGTQPTQPTGLECWESASFNNTTCSWEVAGIQPAQPTGLECWETSVFNNTTCVWDVSGSQPLQPTLECWETATFNNISCVWEVTGSQPAQPTGLECWETSIFNNTTCVWDVSGTQPIQPTLECWESTSFNNTTCVWEVIGTQPVQPTTECWETTIFNDATCVWEVSGVQPNEPTVLECWETTTFNQSTCQWEILGDQPLENVEEFVMFCEGETITLQANTTIVNPTYIWDTGELVSFKIVSESGTYSVEVTDNCLTTIITFIVEQIETPIIETIFSNGSSVIITTSNTGNFLYSLDGNIFQTSNVFYNVEGGLYTIYVKANNCNEEVTSAYLHFYIPQFFTPNDDNKNDTFDLKGIEYFNTSEVYIFNRYGKLLKSTRNAPFSWDGTFNNNPLPTSDYWYVIIIDGQRRVGHFTLKR